MDLRDMEKYRRTKTCASPLAVGNNDEKFIALSLSTSHSVLLKRL